MPSCTRCGGSARISPNWRFEQISCRSASNTAMPCRTWFSAVCRISRLKCSAAWESSSSFSAALAETVRLRSSSDITRREEAAPIEEAIRRSACCSNSKSAGAAGSRLPGWPAAKASKAWRGALGAEILRHRALDVLHGHGGAPAPERRRDRRQRVRHEQIRLQPFDRRRLARERHHDVGQDVERERPEHAVHQRRQVGAEQRPRTQRLDAERSVLQQQQAGGIALQEARQEQRVGPHRDADQHAGHGAARGCPGARTGRRRRPAPAGQSLRTTAGRSPPAGRCRARDSRNTPSP